MTSGSEVARAACSDGLLRVETARSRSGAVVVAPVGEVDAASATLLQGSALDAVAAARHCVVVDLDGLTFCGSTGMVVLLEVRRQAVTAGIRFAVAGGPPIVRRVLEITRLAPVLGHRETVDDALRELVD